VVYVRLRENGPEQVVRNARPQYPHPEADPSHPRYEPPHLRHQPGDEWKIGGKPHDPDDPGVFGSPGWRPDPRTGRHRRGELPDPLPSWQRPRAQAEPPRRRRFWTEPEEDDGERQAVSEVAQEESFLFGRLREDAWDRFMIKSAPLAAAHWADRAALGRQHRDASPGIANGPIDPGCAGPPALPKPSIGADRRGRSGRGLRRSRTRPGGKGPSRRVPTQRGGGPVNATHDVGAALIDERRLRFNGVFYLARLRITLT
jgi:hypothetical protein